MQLCFVRLPPTKLAKSMQRLLNESGDTVMGLHYWPAIIYDDAEDFRGDTFVCDQMESGLSTLSTEDWKYTRALRLLGWSGENWDRSEHDARSESASEFMCVDPNDENLFMSFVENQAEVEKVARDFLKNNRDNLTIHQRRHLKCLQEAMPAALEYHRRGDVDNGQFTKECLSPGTKSRRGKRDRMRTTTLGNTWGNGPPPDTNIAVSPDGPTAPGYHPDPTNLDPNDPSPRNDDAAVCDPCVDEVEDLVSTVSRRTPSPQVITPKHGSTKRKSRTKGSRTKRSRKGRCSAIHSHKAVQGRSGSRLVWNEATHNAPKSRNDRTCLVDSVRAILPGPECIKASIHTAMLSKMPRSGDTSIECINSALKIYNMDLVPVTHIYNKRGGMPYHLLQERQCNLVIRIKLSNLKHQTVYHSVGWDGSIIHDHPKMSIVNQTKDRQYWDGSNDVFEKMYPKKYFSCWQISTVYRLRLLDE